MRYNILIVIIFFGIASCKDADSSREEVFTEVQKTQETFKSFGEKIAPENALSDEEMKLKFETLEPGDTISAKFRTTVNSVCKMKGCWMTLNLPDFEEDPMVKFKDYGFFVPKDIESKEVIVQGIAFIEETSIEDQKHFAEDAGKSSEEIESITQTKKTPGFLANGVLLKQ
ncbi:DUF4920 domain-containing protein [Gramella sp. MAR_2010_147]|uniref:DUF4920 domain-containing protein n=1 Tax=Gramella sp. MAR_2010_147 TaxID=1250205 RepID=UPI00087BF67B|nr:DUF4920 domain-containing protein [Gramella sp. MAR_2010_147]SDS04032.1 protein of unknown function [Gramella sp. MAR_2010_147]